MTQVSSQRYLCLLLGLFVLPYAKCIWPEPAASHHGNSTVWLSPQLKVSYQDDCSDSPQNWDWPYRQLQKLLSNEPPLRFECGPLDENSSNILDIAVQRTLSQIVKTTYTPWKFHPRGAYFEPDPSSTSRQWITRITFTKTDDVQLRSLSEEGYILDLADIEGECMIRYTAIVGALRALSTFSQLFYLHSNANSGIYTSQAPLHIVDDARFPHRGLNLDIARNWIPPVAVKQTIEGMFLAKLNKLHLHASDSQSWPLEISSLPELAQKGAYHPFQVWTVADLEDVQRYGQEHGIEVYLEVDMPGHTTSIGHAFPELITAADERPWDKYALEPPAGQLKLNSSAVTRFLETLLADTLPRTLPFGSLFHFGGDELNLNAYALDDTVNSSSRAVLKPLLQAFFDHVLAIAEEHKVTPILWEEMILDWDLFLPKSTIIQTWRSTSALSKVLAKGHRALFGSNSHWYLDCGHGTFLDPEPSKGNETSVQPPYEDYCSPYKSWRHVYSYDPLKGIPNEDRHLILGGEVHLWGELTDSISLHGMLWPRAAAAGEVMWSGPRGKVDEETTRRLADLRERLVGIGIAAMPVAMEWCLRSVGGCTL
ncbi:N-acetyl-glucosamine-6-phosphate deacetylase [Agyrium rufum]|nr:N-acetyl-glucosamine-6-phosphate deacetylase [Agyrium rufum]